MTKLYVIEVKQDWCRPKYLTMCEALGELKEAYLYKHPDEAEEDLDLLNREYHEVNLREVEMVIVK
jgi:hypothetical protein